MVDEEDNAVDDYAAGGCVAGDWAVYSSGDA